MMKAIRHLFSNPKVRRGGPSTAGCSSLSRRTPQCLGALLLILLLLSLVLLAASLEHLTWIRGLEDMYSATTGGEKPPAGVGEEGVPPTVVAPHQGGGKKKPNLHMSIFPPRNQQGPAVGSLTSTTGNGLLIGSLEPAATPIRDVVAARTDDTASATAEDDEARGKTWHGSEEEQSTERPVAPTTEVSSQTDAVVVEPPLSTTTPLSRRPSTSFRCPPRSFSVVMLSYRSPKSLSHTLRSLVRAEISRHPQFCEVVVYFQVYEPHTDDSVVSSVLAPANVPYRVIGLAANLPVASATFRALRNVTSDFVLYLECDRPAFFPTWDSVLMQNTTHEQWTIAKIHQQLQIALRFVEEGTADVFRLQLYSSSELKFLGGGGRRRASAPKSEWSPEEAVDQVLPLKTYGQDPYTHCRDADHYHQVDDQHGAPVNSAWLRGICLSKKKAKQQGDVFYTAYCKHWKRLSRAAGGGGEADPQQDLCDSFCFFQWATSLLSRAANNSSSGGEVTKLLPLDFDGDLDGSNPRVQQALQRLQRASLHLHPPDVTVDVGKSPLTTSSSSQRPVLCLTSAWCNWSNQPSLYRVSWYLQHIAKPCESSTKYCIGKPGRQSAVRQELYFKDRAVWGNKEHKICLSTGLFIHHEVDNRE